MLKITASACSRSKARSIHGFAPVHRAVGDREAKAERNISKKAPRGAFLLIDLIGILLVFGINTNDLAGFDEHGDVDFCASFEGDFF